MGNLYKNTPLLIGEIAQVNELGSSNWNVNGNHN